MKLNVETLLLFAIQAKPSQKFKSTIKQHTIICYELILALKIIEFVLIFSKRMMSVH